MDQVESVVRALPRIVAACRARGWRDEETGTRVSERQAELLRLLDAEAPTMASELSEALGVTPPTISSALTRLTRDGLVRRQRDPDDRRVVNVTLTESGVRLRDASTGLDPELVGRLLGLVEPTDRADAVEGLVRLADAADRLTAREDAYVRSVSGG